MKRITVDEVKAAYAKTGIPPMRRSWRCCPIGACARAEQANIKYIPGEWGARVLGAEYMWGFADGFDGKDRGASCSAINIMAESSRYADGYDDGQVVADAIFHDTP